MFSYQNLLEMNSNRKIEMGFEKKYIWNDHPTHESDGATHTDTRRIKAIKWKVGVEKNQQRSSKPSTQIMSDGYLFPFARVDFRYSGAL